MCRLLVDWSSSQTRAALSRMKNPKLESNKHGLSSKSYLTGKPNLTYNVLWSRFGNQTVGRGGTKMFISNPSYFTKLTEITLFRNGALYRE